MPPALLLNHLSCYLPRLFFQPAVDHGVNRFLRGNVTKGDSRSSRCAVGGVRALRTCQHTSHGGLIDERGEFLDEILVEPVPLVEELEPTDLGGMPPALLLNYLSCYLTRLVFNPPVDHIIYGRLCEGGVQNFFRLLGHLGRRVFLLVNF